MVLGMGVVHEKGRVPAMGDSSGHLDQLESSTGMLARERWAAAECPRGKETLALTCSKELGSYTKVSINYVPPCPQSSAVANQGGRNGWPWAGKLRSPVPTQTATAPVG